MDWRQGKETDIDEVLQSDQIFSNVSRGILAKQKDLQKVFGTDDPALLTRIILDEGQLQVSEKERKKEAAEKLREITQIIVSQCINSDTQLPFPIGMVEAALKELHFNAHPSKPAKVQALELIRELQKKVLPSLQRAQMVIKVIADKKFGKALKAKILDIAELKTPQSENFGAQFEMVLSCDPGHYRSIDSAVQEMTKGQGRVLIQSMQSAGTFDGAGGGARAVDGQGLFDSDGLSDQPSSGGGLFDGGMRRGPLLLSVSSAVWSLTRAAPFDWCGIVIRLEQAWSLGLATWPSRPRLSAVAR
eukprot:g1862.t1